MDIAIYIDTSKKEELFFAQVRSRFISINNIKSSAKLHRVFRILERISAGGCINASLMLQVIDRCIATKRHRTDGSIIDPVPTRLPSFMKQTDVCTVCLDEFSEPYQLKCGHVFCRICILAMIDLKYTKCAVCRDKWQFPVQLFIPSWSKATNVPGDLNRHSYTKLLEGGVEKTGKTIMLNGKLTAFRKEVIEFHTYKKQNDHIVIYTKYTQTAASYIDELKQHNVSFVVAGFEQSKSVSIQNIEEFKKGNIDILLISTNYSTGLDFPMTSQLWIMDCDIDTNKTNHCKGRITRLNQLHSNITIKTFLYKNSFDDFLYLNQNLGSVPCSLSTCILLGYHYFKDNIDSVYGKTYYLGKLVFGDIMFDIDTSGKGLIINNQIVVNTKTGHVKGTGRSIDDILKLGPNNSFFIAWRGTSVPI